MYKKIISALIPLRGGSKSIPGKNIKMMCGKPLCAWVIEAAIKSKLINDVIVSTDSYEISNVVRSINRNIHIIERDKSLAEDDTPTELVMIDTIGRINSDILITLQATSPLTTHNNINNAISLFLENKYDSLFTAVRTKRFYWNTNAQPLNYDPQNRPTRQNFKGTFMENGAFYITSKELLLKNKCRLGGKIGIYEMSQESSVEIDEPEDWPIVENILMNRD